MNYLLIPLALSLFAMAQRGELAKGKKMPPHFQEACEDALTQFKDHLIVLLTHAEKSYDDSVKCFGPVIPKSKQSVCEKRNYANVQHVKSLRELNLQFHQALIQQWVQEESSGLAKTCFLDRHGKIEFTRNIRLPKIKPDQTSLCQGVLNQWSEFLNNESPQYLNGQKTLPSFSNERKKQLNAYRSAPGNRLLSVNAKHDLEYSDEDIKKELVSHFGSLKTSIAALKRDIASLRPDGFYTLYGFRKEYENFTSSLPDSEKENANQCLQKSGWTQDCVLNINAGCAHRLWEGLKDMVPVLNIVRAMDGLDRNRAADAAGIQSQEESIENQAHYAAMGFFGVAELLPSISLTKAGTASLQLVRQTPSQKLGVSALHDPVRASQPHSPTGSFQIASKSTDRRLTVSANDNVPASAPGASPIRNSLAETLYNAGETTGTRMVFLDLDQYTATVYQASHSSLVHSGQTIGTNPIGTRYFPGSSVRSVSQEYPPERLRENMKSFTGFVSRRPRAGSSAETAIQKSFEEAGYRPLDPQGLYYDALGSSRKAAGAGQYPNIVGQRVAGYVLDQSTNYQDMIVYNGVVRRVFRTNSPTGVRGTFAEIQINGNRSVTVPISENFQDMYLMAAPQNP